jgi:hypothetical protein
MNGFRKIFRIFLSHYATFFAKMAERKVVPFDEFYYQLKLIHLFLLHPVSQKQKSLLLEKKMYLTSIQRHQHLYFYVSNLLKFLVYSDCMLTLTAL